MTLPLAVMVSVDYADLLSITLPRNRHHFERVMVVTTPNVSDLATREVARANNAELFCTNSFYDDGAHFNKWKALEQALDKGWKILARCFEPQETSFRTDLIEQFWPKDISAASTA